MRAALNLLHRWFGLAIAGFLFVSGLTGAVISWDHELDEVLNPHLTDVDSVGPAIPPLELAAKVEAEDPRARVSWITLAAELLIEQIRTGQRPQQVLHRVPVEFVERDSVGPPRKHL